MKIEINFEINDKVWFIHPKSLKVMQANLKGLKAVVTSEGTNIKYNIDVPLIGGAEEVYAFNIYKTKEDLIKSL